MDGAAFWSLAFCDGEKALMRFLLFHVSPPPHPPKQVDKGKSFLEADLRCDFSQTGAIHMGLDTCGK